MTDPATKYAKAVLAGRIKACRLVKLACQRYLRDLKESARLKIHFDIECAQRYIDFIENFLVLAEGDHADRPFLLRPWQQFIVGNIFGWKLEDDSRRFRRVYCELGKGGGKTPLGAAMGICTMVLDNEQSAEIYCAAVSKEQAGISFRDAKIMCEKSPELEQMLDIDKYNIAYPRNFSFFRPISAEARSLDGKRVHFALIDEIHEHPTPLVVNKMVAGLKGRRQPLIMEITNSGYDKNTVCGHHHDYGVEILEGVQKNESWFIFICGLDPCAKHLKEGFREPREGCKDCDQWTDERVWIKANPNLGYSITKRYLRDQVRNALAIPSEQSLVKRLNFCIWTQQAQRWLSMDDWAHGNKAIDYDELARRDCFVGLDLAVTNDFAAIALLFPPPELELVHTEEKEDDKPNAELKKVTYIAIDKLKEPYIVLPFFWLPRDRILEMVKTDRVPYELWERSGHIYANEGNVIDFGFIKQKLLALNDVYHFRAVGYDKTFANQFATEMVNDHGMPMVEIPPGNATLTHPSRELERLVTAHKLQHGGHPVLTWMASNAAIREDSKRRIHVMKPSATKKIDGIMGCIFALTISILNPNVRSVYESRGVLAV